MIVDRDLLRLAEKLCVGINESEWRCAVSRAYYAAFHHARDLLQALGFEVPRGELAHAFLWKRLQSCGNDLRAGYSSRINLAASSAMTLVSKGSKVK